MKILYFNSYYSPDFGGGAEVTLQLLVESMQSAGHEVMVVCTGAEKGLAEDKVNGVKIVRVGLDKMYFPLIQSVKRPFIQRLAWHISDRYNEEIIARIDKCVRDFNPDVVSCHNLSGLSISVYDYIKKLHVPIVQVLHDQYLLCPKTSMTKRSQVCSSQCLDCKILRISHADISNNVDSVVGVSKYILNRFLDYGYFSKSKHQVVINNIRRPDFWKKININQVRKEPAAAVNYGFIGTISEIKGIEILLREFLATALPQDSQLIVAGRGDESYVRMLKDKYFSPRINWIGHQPAHLFYEKIDVLVVPSIWNDTLPGVVFEAFGFGIPVIGSNRGGIPEMIQTGLNGLVFDPSIEGDLAKAISYLSSQATLINFRNQALDSSKPYQDVESWVDRYLNVYTEAVDSKRAQIA